ncbi:MAG: DUF4956 domain-containing protein [candidate division Zixibacteria bacterium]|nr:DUF4956 domain-containing protein [candidate division Zixibacteria bacterium]
MKGSALLDHIVVRLVVYYIASFLFFAALWELLPGVFLEFQVAERIEDSSLPTLDFEQFEADAGLSQVFVPVTMSLLFSFLFALPVVWVYRWTRPRKKYDPSFAQTLLVVPIAIALVVFLVKDSIALAFSIAGIVAAVRFRTSLNETMDAIYMFIVIGIGLAAGIQYGSVAILASVAFNAVVLVVWRMNWGAEPAVLSGLRLVHPPGGHPAPDGSDPQANKKPKPFTARLRVHTSRSEAAQQAAEALLATYAARWQFAGVVEEGDDASIVEFDVRMKKKSDPAAFTAALEKITEGHAAKVELEERLQP